VERGSCVKNFVKYFNRNISNEQYRINLENIEEYINGVEARYAKTKTLINRANPIDIFDEYVVPDIRFSDSTQVIRPSFIDDLFSITTHGIFTGSGGVGKSSLFRYFLIKSLRREERIPILFELRYLKESSFFENIFEYTRNLGLKISKDTFIDGLHSGCFVLLLDALDELNTHKQKELNESVNEFIKQYSNVPIFISSRPIGTFLDWSQFSFFHIEPLSWAQSMEYINKITYDNSVKSPFIQYIEENRERFQAFTGNPLLLSNLLLTYDSFAEIDVFKSPNALIENMVNTLFVRHDATKEGYQRGYKYSFDTYITVCKIIGFRLYFTNSFNISADDFDRHIKKLDKSLDSKEIADNLVSTSIFIREGHCFSFCHKLFQDYFAVRYIAELDDISYVQAIRKVFEIDTNTEILNQICNFSDQRFEFNVVYPALVNLEMAMKCNVSSDLYLSYFDLLVQFIDVHDCLLDEKDAPHVKFNVGFLKTVDAMIVVYYAKRKFSLQLGSPHEIDKRIFKIIENNKINISSKNNTIFRIDQSCFDIRVIQKFLRQTIDIGQLIESISRLKQEILGKRRERDDSLNWFFDL